MFSYVSLEALACVECNKFKANRTPDEARMTLRKLPKKPSWKALAQIPRTSRRESWDAFISRACWEVELGTRPPEGCPGDAAVR